MTPHDKVRKAAEEWFSRFKVVGDAADYTAAENELASIIESHCHVTEMEAVVEKAREALLKSKGELEFQIEEMSDSVSYSHTNEVLEEVQSALSSIDALKGDRK